MLGGGGEGADCDKGTLVLIQAGRGLFDCPGAVTSVSMCAGDWAEGVTVIPCLVCPFAGRLVS